MIQTSNEKLSIKTHTETPPNNSIMNPQLIQQNTLYDYLTLLPALIVAITPLILGLRGKESFKQGRKTDQDNS